jgi:hypothetical protein
MRSFDLVDFKVLEAQYFLEKMEGFVVIPEINYLFSAYSSACRSITFCLQSVLKDIEGFEVWYFEQQELLKNDPLSRFFVEARNLSQKVGVVPISGGAGGLNQNGEMTCTHYFDIENPDFKNLPERDVVSSCREQFVNILNIIYECYVKFGVHIDAHQYYTAENLKHIGKTIDDADEEIIGIRGWTQVDGWPEAYRWNSLRDKVPGCRIADLFVKYLNKHKPHPPIPASELENYIEVEWIPPSIKK